ncbi:MAG TPA: hypothetical protein VE291_01625 [Terracidiphilus sp.]|jgi:cytochrome b subunit of formate dehydrogenase|nr:hypothetical protein [Terracidiphilus sp.]
MAVQETELIKSKTMSRGTWLVGVTSFAFILLQSACTAVMALSGVGLLIGATSFAAASIIPGFVFTIHTRWIRIPMMTFAVLGSVANLYVLWRIRSLRSRPSAQWRTQQTTARQKRSEMLQIVLSILTLALVAAESLAHLSLHDSF